MTLLLAYGLEWWVGDPPNRWHPVAWFGRWATWCEAFLYASHRKAGVAAWCLVLALPLVLLWLGHGLSGWLFDVLVLWLSLGWKSLFGHVRRVLDAPTLQQARAALALIVSRDVRGMTREDTRRSAVESLAENASDAVIAPLFWFVAGGGLGVALYRMVNTLDAMWGYRNERYQYFGWLAAKSDDVMNWIPARITAWLMLRVGQSVPWKMVQEQARTHASPNAGWPEVALAYAANVRLGGSVKRDGVVDERPFYGMEDAQALSAAGARHAVYVVRHTLLWAAGLSLLVQQAIDHVF